MELAVMNVRILLPERVFLERSGVSRLVVETSQGYFGFLPHRLDCAATLVPGILLYETRTDGVKHVAHDEGLLIKTGLEVTLTVHYALAGPELGSMKKAFLQEVAAFVEREKGLRTSISRLEKDFLRRLAELRPGQ